MKKTLGKMAMERVFEAINGVFSFIGPLSDFLWEFPTNFGWYSSIPILGNISFAIILLLGSGIFFSFRIGFMQVTYFKKGIRTMTEKRVVETGISPLASFFLSSAMLAGNILGKTRTVSVAIATETAAGNFDIAGFWVVVIILLSFVVVAAINIFSGRGMRTRRWI